jgi:hypothetical protein
LRVAFRRVASTARVAAVAPGLLGWDGLEAPLRVRGVLEAASAASAIFEPGREWRVPTGSRSASMGGFFFMTSPVSYESFVHARALLRTSIPQRANHDFVKAAVRTADRCERDGGSG